MSPDPLPLTWIACIVVLSLLLWGFLLVAKDPVVIMPVSTPLSRPLV